MLHGDISNQRSFMIGFRCEGSLLKYRDSHLGHKILNLVSGKFRRAEVDPEVLSLMRYLYWNTEYTVMLIIDDENYTDEAKEYLENFPYNQVANIKSISEVTMMLNTGEMSYYIDNNDTTRYKVQNRHAMTLQEFNSELRRNYGRLT